MSADTEESTINNMEMDESEDKKEIDNEREHTSADETKLKLDDKDKEEISLDAVKPDELKDDIKKPDELKDDIQDNKDDLNVSSDDHKTSASQDNKDEIAESSGNKQPPKRRMSETVITISDSDSSDSSVCHINSYLASPSEAKRIRRDYSSDSDSYNHYDSSTTDEDENEVVPFKKNLLELALDSIQLKERAPRLDEPKFNECFLSSSIESSFRMSWDKNECYTSTNINLQNEPFKLCILENFLSNENFINNIVDDMYTLEWSRKKMDLYEFHQTFDLENISWQRAVKGVYDLLKMEIMPWISKLTGTTLTNVSASGSFYGTGDHLLVHDDLLGDRKIAFIFYVLPWDINNGIRSDNDSTSDLAKNGSSSSNDPVLINSNIKGWSEKLGGSLDLYSTDSNGNPSEVIKKIVPSNNMFTFFEVSKKSYHQVSEVASFDFPRLSINGWFHGPTEKEENKKNVWDSISELDSQQPHKNVVFLTTWITPTYLLPGTKFRIQQQIEKASEISLESFLINQQYVALLESLKDETLQWTKMGPPNQRNYETLPISKINEFSFGNPLKTIIQILTSFNFMQILVECTDLSLKCYNRLSVQRWSSGSYSVIPQKEEYSRNDLDLVLYLGCSENEPCGGATVYLAPEETHSDPLVTLDPKNNALNIVYADRGTANFTRYVSKLATKQEPFYIIRCTYNE